MSTKTGKPTSSRSKKAEDPDAPPAHLGDAGRALWVQLIHDFTLRDAAARALLQVACEAADRHAAACAVLAADGPVFRDRFNAPRGHPAATVARDAHSTMISAFRALGLTGVPEGSADA